VKEDLEKLNGHRPSEVHTIIAWDGEASEQDTRDYCAKKLKENFEVIFQKLLSVDKRTERRLAKALYGHRNRSRVRGGKLYLVVILDKNPIYEWQRSTSCNQFLNVNMKYLKEDMRTKIGGGINEYFSIHGSYNLEETLIALEPLNLQHLIERPTFDDFGELFDMLNNDDNLEYVVQRSFHELENSPSFFKKKDVDVLVNDYYYFKAITGARSVDRKRMRENNNGSGVQSKIQIGGVEAPFDIRFIGDDFVDSMWEQDMLDRRILHEVNNKVKIYIPNKEDELYSLLYNILVQKKRPKKSNHVPRVNFLRKEFNQDQFNFGKRWIHRAWNELRTFMESNGYQFKKPKDETVGFNI
jgi:hypothetical protein